MRRLATAFISLLIVVALGATGCSTFGTGQTQNEAKPVIGSTHQDHSLRVRIDSLCWSWKSESMPVDGITGAFSIELEATIKNVGKCKLYPPIFSVGEDGLVSWSQAGCREGMIRGNECKLRIANSNQVHLEFNNSDPGKEILLTVQATDQCSEFSYVTFTLPPPLQMPRCGE